MNAGTLSLLGRSPNVASVVLNDFLDNGKADAAASGAGISGSIRAIKPVKNILQILLLRFCRIWE